MTLTQQACLGALVGAVLGWGALAWLKKKLRGK